MISSLQTLECQFPIVIFPSYCQIILRNRAKHLHSPDEQLHSLAGSFGYVAPEVLHKDGHGKPVDVWATGYVPSNPHLSVLLVPTCRYTRIITYVILCGYPPFRSDDVKILLRETLDAKIEFHDRYWQNISQEGASKKQLSHFTSMLICRPQP